MRGRAIGVLGSALVGMSLFGCVVVEKRDRGNNNPPPPPPDNSSPAPRTRNNPPPPPAQNNNAGQADNQYAPEPGSAGTPPSSGTSGNAYEPPEKLEGQTEVQVQAPPNKEEQAYAPPGPNYKWLPGHWEYHGGWQWKMGVWYMGPSKNKIWVGGYWGPTGRGTWAWVPGRWKDGKK